MGYQTYWVMISRSTKVGKMWWQILFRLLEEMSTLSTLIFSQDRFLKGDLDEMDQ